MSIYLYRIIVRFFDLCYNGLRYRFKRRNQAVNRPRYVQQAHIDTQDRITETVAERIGYNVVKYMPAMSVCSHVLQKRRVTYVVKSMKRNCPPNASYLRDDGFAISADKVDRLQTMAENAKGEAVLLIEFSDGHIYFLNLSQVSPDAVRNGGRTDRGDAEDVEPENYYHMDNLRQIV